MDSIKFFPMGEDALIMEFGDTMNIEMNNTILSWKKTIETAAIPGVSEIVPAYTTLTVFYRPEDIS
ncbi:hypothetical protein ACA29_10455 [Lederbergia galactosidilytica]|uniref:Carboxyltransferase domain-containing protein n=1 Tax=Lederbergia galactosidilytica TaxID=217031 RepID=A0A0Q9Y4Q6_9BACI|nr:hypothetical protein ACA29_10455 [Lederbergia galactosidilytica]